MSEAIGLDVAAGKKGEVPRLLARKVREVIELRGGGVRLSDRAVALLGATRRAANKIIAASERGDEVKVVCSVVEGPLGGWSINVLVDIEPPPAKGKERR